MIVYHVMLRENAKNYKIGDTIKNNKNRDISAMPEKKRETEELYEEVRKRDFNGLPSRLSGLFVFESKEDAEEYIKYLNAHKESPKNYSIFELDVYAPVYWFNMDEFTISAACGSKESKAKKYWNGGTTVYSTIKKIFPEDLIEGITQSDAVIKQLLV